MTLSPARLQGGWLNPNRLGDGPRWAIYQPQDADARTYINAVEAADGQPLESAVRAAIDALFQGVKTDNGGSLSAFNQFGLLAGPRTVAGCMVPMAGTVPTSVNFVSGDLSRTGGLIGDGSTKLIDTNVAGTALTSNNFLIFCWMSATGSDSANRMLIGNVTTTGSVSMSDQGSSSNIRFRVQATTVSDAAGAATVTGFKGAVRTSSAGFTYRTNGANTAITRASEALSAVEFGVFSLGPTISNGYDGRIAAWGLASAPTITLAQLETRLQTYLDALSAAGI